MSVSAYRGGIASGAEMRANLMRPDIGQRHAHADKRAILTRDQCAAVAPSISTICTRKLPTSTGSG